MQLRLTRWRLSLLAALLFPPLGVILFWTRREAGLVLKGLCSLCFAVLTVVYLVVFFGMRVELDGSARRPIFYFGSRESHFEALENERVQQKLASAQESTGTAGKIALVNPRDTGNSEATPYWTDFRGPNRDGHYQEHKILTCWSDGLEELWRQRIGGGYASFVIANGRAYTIEQRRAQEVVAAYDIRTGREVWTNHWMTHFQEPMGGAGPRATPTWNEGMLYALGAEGELRCLEADSGRIAWAKNILEENEADNLKWAMAASPLVTDRKVITLPGGTSGNSIVAYDKSTGVRIWQALSDRQAYTSPMLVNLAGCRQLLVVTAERVVGLTVEEGQLLWEYPWSTSHGVNAAQPIIVDPNRFYISAGYGHGAAMVEITRQGDRLKTRTLWQTHRMKNKFSSAVLHEGYIYGLDEAILACIAVETGELMWKGGRYGYGQLLLASGHLVIVTEGGELVLVKATPESHQELARFSAIRGKTWNCPALGGGVLLVRNTREMACFRISNSPT